MITRVTTRITFLVMIILTVFVVIIKHNFIPTTYTTFTSVISGEENETEDFCNVVRLVNENQLQTFLNDFYKGSILDYDHTKTTFDVESKVNDLPVNCLRNIYIEKFFGFIKIPQRLEEYRHRRSNEFEKNHMLAMDKNATCEGKRCVYYNEEITKVNYELLENKNREINERLIKDELELLRKTGLEKGDDDLENLDFMKNYVTSNLNQFKVPNLVHFVFFSCHDFQIADYLCVLSALRYQNPDFILLHGDCEPEGEYWKWLKREAGDKLKFIKKSPPETIFRYNIPYVEHQADVARLQILLQVGGMYFDMDTMVLRSLDDLRKDDDIVLGKEADHALANGAILANKDSWFLKKWFQEYHAYNSNYWGKNSVRVPMVLYQLFPDQIRVIDVNMMRPRWDEMNPLHNGLVDWSEHWTIHLATRSMPEKDKKRTIAQFARLETSYGELARHVLWGNSAKKDVTSWVLHPDFNKL